MKNKQKFPENLAEEINLEISQNLEKEKLFLKIDYCPMCLCALCLPALCIFPPFYSIWFTVYTVVRYSWERSCYEYPNAAIWNTISGWLTSWLSLSHSLSRDIIPPHTQGNVISNVTSQALELKCLSAPNKFSRWTQRRKRATILSFPYSKWFVTSECRTGQAQQQLSEEKMPTTVLGPHTVLSQHCISCSGLKELPNVRNCGPSQEGLKWAHQTSKALFTILSLSYSPSDRQGQPTALNILLGLQQVTNCTSV